MDLGNLGNAFTVLLFGAVGWALAHRRGRPAGPLAFVLLLVAAAVGSAMGTRTIIVGVQDFRVMLNWALAALCLGAVVGLLLRNVELRKLREH